MEKILNKLNDIDKKLDILLNKEHKIESNEEFLGVVELARLLKIEQKTIYNWISLGKIPYTKVNGRLLFSRVLINNFIREKSFK